MTDKEPVDQMSLEDASRIICRQRADMKKKVEAIKCVLLRLRREDFSGVGHVRATLEDAIGLSGQPDRVVEEICKR